MMCSCVYFFTLFLSMANVRMTSLVGQSEFSLDDAEEVLRIFEILTPKRQIEVIDNWSSIETKIKTNREKVEQEKYLLLLKTIGTIEAGMEDIERKLRRTVVLSSKPRHSSSSL